MCSLKIFIGIFLWVVALEVFRFLTITEMSFLVIFRKLNVSFVFVIFLILRMEGCFSYFLIALSTGSEMFPVLVIVLSFIFILRLGTAFIKKVVKHLSY